MTPINAQNPAETRKAEVVRLLMSARQQRQPVVLPEWIERDVNEKQAYALQAAHVETLLERAGGCVTGMKLSPADPAAMASLGYHGPFRGPIFSSFTYPSGSKLHREDYVVCGIEAEIGVLIGKDIGGTAQVPMRAELVQAIDALFPCIEVAEPRISNFMKAHPAAVVADLAFAGGWIRGESRVAVDEIDLLTLPVRLLCNGKEVRSGIGARISGDPLNALAAAIADLGRHGLKLTAGQVVSTGTYTMPYLAQPGDSLVADFGPVGHAAVSFS